MVIAGSMPPRGPGGGPPGGGFPGPPGPITYGPHPVRIASLNAYHTIIPI